MAYRTSIQIIANLLVVAAQSGQEEIKATHLLAKVNLAHSKLSKIIKNLTGVGLINRIHYD